MGLYQIEFSNTFRPVLVYSDLTEYVENLSVFSNITNFLNFLQF